MSPHTNFIETMHLWSLDDKDTCFGGLSPANPLLPLVFKWKLMKQAAFLCPITCNIYLYILLCGI